MPSFIALGCLEIGQRFECGCGWVVAQTSYRVTPTWELGWVITKMGRGALPKDKFMEALGEVCLLCSIFGPRTRTMYGQSQ